MKTFWRIYLPLCGSLLAGCQSERQQPVGNPSAGWARNDIDRFVAQAHVQRGLNPAPEADRYTLLRRVTLDLTGLPPTPAEIDAFVADKAPDAYENVVERLLNSPHYGEHQATFWLDVARYADTHGYQLDVTRTAWPYRDWVIRAFNQNLPYDRFVTWQLAGDLLPSTANPAENRDRLVATAFNRMHPQNQEGGIVEDEYRAEYAADRTNTFGKAMLGLTVECARCHDHKYDPISQKDYYGLFAFFDKINEAGQVPFNGESSPTITLTDAKAEEQLRAIQQQLAQLDRQQKADAVRTQADYRQWLTRQPKTGVRPNWRGLIGRYTFDDTTRTWFTNSADTLLPAQVSGNRDLLPQIRPGRFGRGRLVNGEGHIDLGPTIGYFERHDAFSVSMWIKLTKKGLRGPVFARSNGLDNGNRGYECMMNPDGTLSFYLAHSYPDHAIDLQTIEKVPVGRWVHLTVTYDGSGSARGTHIYLDGREQPVRVQADRLQKSILYGFGRQNGFGLVFNFMIGGKFRDSMADFLVDELALFNREVSPDEVAFLGKKTNQLNPSLTYYRSAVDTISARYREQRACLRQQETQIYDACEEVMVMRERRHAKPTHLLKRGAYDAPGEVIQPGTPHFLPTLGDDLSRNRLGLAQWLLRADNPLFARVAVNRIWQQYFGQGLVKSSDDFGNQGNLPTHPELLDYLAIRFREGWTEKGIKSWDVKALHRLVVLSATYRQSSVVSAKAREIDFDNSYLSRGPSYRLSAEQIRDNALTVSGLLVRKLGGASVYPYQPAGVWESVSTTQYPASHGDSLYRRTLYTFWRRTTPHPALINFDASERHMCTVKRQKTATPLQALVTLNDPQYVEAARVLAQRVVPLTKRHSREATNNANEEVPPTIINTFFKAILSRPARPQEMKWMEQLYREEFADFRKNPVRASELLAVGEHSVDQQIPPSELAAWTVVASTIMNMDEMTVKR